MSQNIVRHQRILGGQIRRIVASLAALGTLLGVPLGQSVAHHNQQVTAHAKAQSRAKIYRIMAGEEQPSSARVSESFAADMQQLLKSGQPMENFRTTSNRYGGIVQELGYNPFNEKFCTSCRLSDRMIADLRIIKLGNVDKLIADEIAATKPSDVPFGKYVGIGVVYILITAVGALALSIRKDSKQNGYEPSELNWQATGSAADLYKRLSLILAPGYIVVLKLQRKKGKTFEAVLDQISMGDSYRSLRNMLQEAKALPPDEQPAVRRQIESLIEDLHRMVGDHTGNQRTFEPSRVPELRQALLEVSDRIAAMQQSRREVGLEGDQTNSERGSQA